MLGVALINLASYLITQAETVEAKEVLGEALAVVSAEGGYIVRVCLQQCAVIAGLDGRSAEAAQLVGFVDAGYAAAGEVREPTEQRIYEQFLKRLSDTIRLSELAPRTTEGSQWSEKRAVDFAFRAILFAQKLDG